MTNKADLDQTADHEDWGKGMKKSTEARDFLNQNTEIYTVENSRSGAEPMPENPMRPQFLTNVLEQTAQPFAAIYPDGGVMTCNPAFCQLTGYTKDELLRMNWLNDLTPPVWRRIETDRLASIHNTGNPERYEKEIIRKDGSAVPVELFMHQVSDQSGKALFYWSFITDITESKLSEAALKTQQAQLTTIFDSISDPIYVCDPETHEILYTNQFTRELFGQNVKGLKCHQAFHHRETPCEHCPNPTIMQEKDRLHQWDYRNPVLNRDFMMMSRAIKWPDGRDVKFLIAIDITERKAAKEELAREKERLDVTLKSIGDAVIAVDINGKVVLINPVAETLTGWSKEEAVGQPLHSIFNILNEKTGEPAENPVHRVLKEGRVIGLANHTALIAKDDTVRSIADSAAPIHDASGSIIGVILVFRDVTNERKQEEALRASEVNYRTIFNMVNDAIIVHNADTGAILDVNFKVTELFGYSPEEMQRLGLGAILTNEPPYTTEDAERWIKKVARGEPEVREWLQVDKSGRRLWIEVNLKHAVIAGKNCVLAVMRDITDRRQADEALRRQARELEASNAELKQFAYVASHDLQEPLRMVASYVQLLARRYQGKLDSNADEFIAFVVEGVNRMQALINDLLTYSRVGTREQVFYQTNCEEVLDQALGNLKMAIEESEAVITRDPLPSLTADFSQLVQVFQNLVGNALKFRGQEQPHIHISAQHKGSEWVFSVKDNGIGIEPEYAQRIFMIFQRLYSKADYPGSGIGLAICKKIIERHGGKIWVDSQPGRGSTFFFTIPTGRSLKYGNRSDG